MENNKEKIFSKKEDRTNPLSKVDGGHVVEIHYRDNVRVYDNVKNPRAYITTITEATKYPILAIFVDGIQTKFI